MKKYELIAEKSIEAFGKKLFRIRALVSFGSIKAGDEGGYVESEKNIDQSGDAWVSGDAQVYGDAQVSGDAQVLGDARVSGAAQVSGDAQVSGYAQVSGDAQVFGDARVSGYARVHGDARVSGDAQVYGDARVYGDALVSGDAWVSGNAQVSGDARVHGAASIIFFSNVGSYFGTLTAFRNKDNGITVTRGCFLGTLDEFRAKVIKTHGGTLHEKAYLGLANYIELHFNELHPFEGK